jgi:hypothetical protein
MKLLAAAALTLVATLSSAFAAEEFGGIKFHSSIPKNQIETLKTDLRYLYQNPLTKADQQFMATAQIAVGDGQNLHNWLLNRVRYIVGESFKLDEPNIVAGPYDRFPNTPIPDAFKAIAADSGGVKTVMTNIGGALYLVGKSQKALYGVKFDGETVYAKGPRIGLLQVGEGLFLQRFLLNPNPLAASNSISRLGTLFHEARHSDGNGKSTGFLHFTCPAGHPYATYAACEASANGSYTVGGLSERHMLANCTSCDKKEQGALAAKVADSFNRIIKISLAAADLANQINQLKTIQAQYTAMLPKLKPADKVKVEAELAKIKPMIVQMEAQYKIAAAKPVNPSALDPRPEGLIVMITVPQSSAAMNRSLQK